MSTDSILPQSAITALMKLPQQRSDLWLLLVRRVRGFVLDEKERPVRPYCLLLFSLSPVTQILRQEFLTEKPVAHYPKLEQIVKSILKAMLEPNSILDSKPHRPNGIVFTDERIANVLKPTFETKLGINIATMTEEQNAGFGDEILESFSKRLADADALSHSEPAEKPGLLKSKGMTKEICHSFFDTAKKYYEAQPWMKLLNGAAYAVRFAGQVRYFTIFGKAADDSPGIGIFRDWAGYQKMIGKTTPDDSWSLLFLAPQYVSHEDLDGIDTLGWPVAHNRVKANTSFKEELYATYPVPTYYRSSEDSERPAAIDMKWFEFVMRSAIEFAKVDVVGESDSPIHSYTFEIYGKSYAVDLYPIGTSKPSGEWDVDTLPKVVTEFRECNKCGKNNVAVDVSFKRCARCKKVYYCNAECQQTDWAKHKANCQASA
eukprot:TRINITY_DN1283_c0_g1_i1.p1 TRINITY_DN1283_c0_g1~~TRINITY_DN1283_c0_g1_i1.p1  ORF type:complete len:431 (-),score=90.33 TRINITY_DN1283_c0_g1_i1:354-1646(-)